MGWGWGVGVGGLGLEVGPGPGAHLAEELPFVLLHLGDGTAQVVELRLLLEELLLGLEQRHLLEERGQLRLVSARLLHLSGWRGGGGGCGGGGVEEAVQAA